MRADLQLRELTAADLPNLAVLCAHGLRDTVPLALLARLFEAEPDFNPAYHLALEAADGTLVGAILGGIRTLSDGPVGGVRLLLVNPALRRRGLGSWLLSTLEERMAADGLAELRCGGLAPNYLWPGVDVRDTPAICMLQRHGYTRAGDAINMDVDLALSDWSSAGAEARLAAHGWHVRGAAAGDAAPLTAWVAAQFSAAWTWEARAACANSPSTAFIAERAGQIGGFACYDVSGTPGYFGPTGTDPAVRGSGLGRVLLLRCLAAMRERGYQRAEIGWVGPVGFYSHIANATIGRVCWFMRKELGA